MSFLYFDTDLKMIAQVGGLQSADGVTLATTLDTARAALEFDPDFLIASYKVPRSDFTSFVGMSIRRLPSTPLVVALFEPRTYAAALTDLDRMSMYSGLDVSNVKYRSVPTFGDQYDIGRLIAQARHQFSPHRRANSGQHQLNEYSQG